MYLYAQRDGFQEEIENRTKYYRVGVQFMEEEKKEAKNARRKHIMYERYDYDETHTHTHTHPGRTASAIVCSFERESGSRHTVTE